MKSLIIAASAASVAAFALPAAAQGLGSVEPDRIGVYGDLGYSGTDVNGANQGSIQGRLGYRFHPNIGVEGEVGFGVSDGDRTFAAGTAAERNVVIDQKHNEAAYVVGYLPVTPRTDVFARVGYGRASYDVNPGGAIPAYDADSHGFRYGLGAQHFFDGANGVRVDYTRYEVQELDDGVGYMGGENGHNEWSISYTRKF